MELSSLTIFVFIVSVFLANYALRFAPLAILSRVEIPRPIMRWLSYTPIAVLGALVTVEIILPAIDAAFFPGTIPAGADAPIQYIPLFMNPGIYAGLAAMLVFYKTRSFIGASVIGVALFALLSLFI